MTVFDETVPAALDGQRIDRVVAMITGISRSAAVEAILSGRVTVDERPISRPADRLSEYQTVRIELEDDDGPVRPAADPSIIVPIVHEDADVVVVDKPAGLVVHPSAGHEDGTLVNGLLATHPQLADVGDPTRPGIVHRLDRGTSGLLVVAKTERALRTLSEQLRTRTMLRRYTTLVWGHPESPRGIVDAPIGRSPRRPTKMAVVEDGREARTHYEVVERFHDPVEVALLSCRLETGRTHQIRVHLAAIGHRIVGDERYDGVRQSLPCPRPFLHAAEIGFDHPDGSHLSFTSDLPVDLEAVLASLGG